MENPYQSPSQNSADPHIHTDPEVRTGRVVVLCVIAFAIGMSLATIVLFNLTAGSQKLPQQVVRFALTVGLAVCLYQGYTWARYVLAVLFALGAGLSLLLFPIMLGKAPPIMLAYLIVMTGGYAASAAALFCSASVGRFQEHQRRPQPPAR